MRRILIGVAIAALATTHALAQSDNQRAAVGAAATIGAPLALGAAVGTTATHMSWTTIATQTWNFPWTYKPFNFGSVVGQGFNAAGQHINNIINPNYFNESLHLTGPDTIFKPDAGAHTAKADYNQQHARTTKSNFDAVEAVGICIIGSAVGAIATTIIKASAMGNPPRWRSQAEHERIVASGVEKKFELTNTEGITSTAFCGLGGIYVAAQYARR